MTSEAPATVDCWQVASAASPKSAPSLLSTPAPLGRRNAVKSKPCCGHSKAPVPSDSFVSAKAASDPPSQSAQHSPPDRCFKHIFSDPYSTSSKLNPKRTKLWPVFPHVGRNLVRRNHGQIGSRIGLERKVTCLKTKLELDNARHNCGAHGASLRHLGLLGTIWEPLVVAIELGECYFIYVRPSTNRSFSLGWFHGPGKWVLEF